MISSAIYLCSKKNIFFSNFLKETLKQNENCFFKCFYVLGIWDNYWLFKVCISWLLLASLCIIIASFTSKNTGGLARDSWQVRGTLSDVDCCGIMEPAIKIQQLSIVNWHQLMCFFFWKFIANLIFFWLKLTFFGFFKFLGNILRNMFLFCHAKKLQLKNSMSQMTTTSTISLFVSHKQKSKHKIALNCCQMTLNTQFGLNKL